MITMAIGCLRADPVLHANETGEAFWTAKIRDGETWINLIADGRQGRQLAALTEGSPVSVCGIPRIDVMTDKNGEPSPGLGLRVTKIVALEKVRKKKREPRTTSRRRRNVQQETAA